MQEPIDKNTARPEQNSASARPLTDAPVMNNPSEPSQPDKITLYSDQSTRPAMLPVQWGTIPAALRALPQWVAWELRWVKKRACWAKVPLDVRGVSVTQGYNRAKSDTPATWSAFDRVRAAWGKTYGTFTPADPCGPGFVFKADGGILGIDGDKCRNPVTGELSAFAVDLMRRLPGYWEVSPSGTGIKGIFFGSLPEGGRGRKVEFPDGQGCEVYDRGRYFAITGQRIDGAAADLTSCAEQLPAFLSEFFPVKGKQSTVVRVADNETAPNARRMARSPVDVVGTSERLRRARGYLRRVEGAVEYKGGDNATYRAACILVLGFDLSPTDAFPLMCEWNDTCSPPWPDTGWLWRKLTEADKVTGPRGGLLTERESFGPIGYTDITPAEAVELMRDPVPQMTCGKPTPPPPPCPFQASKDMRDDINLTTRRCPNQSPVRFAKKTVRFVCNRDCGNGSLCRPCLDKRSHKLLRMSDTYIIRTSVLNETTDADSNRVLVARIWNTGPTKANTKAVLRAEGERVSILTDDPKEVASLLAGDGGDVSQFFPEDHTVEEDYGEIETLPVTRLWVLSLPAGSEVPTGFALVTPAAAIRALHHAAKTVPLPPEGTRYYKPHHKSAGWGDIEQKEPSDTRALGPSAFSVPEVERIARAGGVPLINVQFDGRGSRTTGIGWSLPPLQSAAMDLWIGGTAYPEEGERPTADEVIELIQHWRPVFKQLATEIGDGYFVQQVLRKNVWHKRLYDISTELRRAHKEDVSRAAVAAEFAGCDLFGSLS